MGPMDSFVAPRSPTGSAGQKRAVVATADEHSPRRRLLLKVTLQAEILIALQQKLFMDAAVRRMTRRASLAHRFVFEDKRSSLRDMTFRAGIIFAR